MKHKLSVGNGIAVLFTTFVDYFGLGMSFILLPGAILSNNGLLAQTTSPTTRIFFMSTLMMLYPLGQLFGAQFIARLSDRFGKKKMLLTSLTGTLIGTIIAALAFVSKDFYLACAGRLVTGLFAANTAISDSYMAHMSTKQTKTRNLAISQAVFGFGWILGPRIAGLFTDQYSFWGTSTPLWLLIGLLTINIGIVALCLTEHINSHIAPTNMILRIKEILCTLTTNTTSSLFAVWALFIFGWSLYVQFMAGFLIKTHSYNTTQTGKAFALMGAIYMINQLISVRLVAKWLKPRNAIIFITPLTGMFLFYIAYLTSPHYLLIPLVGFATAIAFSRTNILAALSNSTPRHKQGETMGLTWSLQAFGLALAASPIGGMLFAWTPGGPLIAGGCLILASALFLFVVVPRSKAVSQ